MRLLLAIILCVTALLALAVSVFGCIKGDIKAMVAGQISGVVVLGICLLYIQLFCMANIMLSLAALKALSCWLLDVLKSEDKIS